jgi:flagellin
VTTAALNLSGLSVQPADQINYLNQDIGSSGSNDLVAGAAEQRVSDALDQISDARAQIGAQVVAMNETSSTLSNQVVQQTASESAIRDADVGASETSFVKDQVLAKISQSVLAQMQVDAHLVVNLFARSASG